MDIVIQEIIFQLMGVTCFVINWINGSTFIWTEHISH